MKSKKDKKIFIVLILILFISVGFAYLTANLNINGLAVLKKSTWDVHFENIKVENESAQIDVPAKLSNNNLKLDFEVTLDTPGGEYSFYVDVVNNSTFDVMVNNVQLTNIDPNIQNLIVSTVTYSDGISIRKNDLLKENTKEVLKVSIKYKKDVQISELPSNDTDFNMTLNLEVAQADDNAKERERVEVISRKTPGILSVGDEVKIKNEYFNVVSYDEDTTKLLAKYNLNVGNNIQDGEVGIQNEKSVGNGGEYVNGKFPSTVSFSGSNYWANSDGNLKSEYGTDFRNNLVLDSNYSSESGSNYSVAYYINNYVSYLNSLGLNNIKGRLLSYNEVVSLGCNEENTNCREAPSFVHNTTYWLGSANDNLKLWYIDIRGYFFKMSYDNDNNLGVRPVIEIPSSQLPEEVVITFDANGGENVSSSKVGKRMFDTLEDNYYTVLEGPKSGYSSNAQGTVTIEDDSYKVSSQNSAINTGVHWNLDPLPLNEPYYFEVSVKGTGSWVFGQEQDGLIYTDVTKDYKKYTKNYIAGNKNHQAVVFYRTNNNVSDYLNVKSFKLVHLLPEAVKPGEKFLGWYTSPDSSSGKRINKDTLVTENTTYYAHWLGHRLDINTYVGDVQVDSSEIESEHKGKIKFDLYKNNNKVGTFSDFNQIVEYGNKYEIKNITYDETKYNYLGYDTFLPSKCSFNNPTSVTIDFSHHNGKTDSGIIIINLFFEVIE